MIGLVVSVKVKPDQRERFLVAAEDDSTSSVRDEPGCVRFDVLQDQKDENHFFFYEIYRDDAAVDAHRQTPHYARWAAARDLTVDEIVVTRSTVLFAKNYN